MCLVNVVAAFAACRGTYCHCKVKCVRAIETGSCDLAAVEVAAAADTGGVVDERDDEAVSEYSAFDSSE